MLKKIGFALVCVVIALSAVILTFVSQAPSEVELEHSTCVNSLATVRYKLPLDHQKTGLGFQARDQNGNVIARATFVDDLTAGKVVSTSFDVGESKIITVKWLYRDWRTEVVLCEYN